MTPFHSFRFSLKMVCYNSNQVQAGTAGLQRHCYFLTVELTPESPLGPLYLHTKNCPLGKIGKAPVKKGYFS